MSRAHSRLVTATSMAAQMYGNRGRGRRCARARLHRTRPQIFLTSPSTTPTIIPERVAASIARSLKTCAPTTSTSPRTLLLPTPSTAETSPCRTASRTPSLRQRARHRPVELRARPLSKPSAPSLPVPPHALQVEAHPFLPNEALRPTRTDSACLKHGRPWHAGAPSILNCRHRRRTSSQRAAQVTLRWPSTAATSFLPKTLSPARMATNIGHLPSAYPDQCARIDAFRRRRVLAHC